MIRDRGESDRLPITVVDAMRQTWRHGLAWFFVPVGWYVLGCLSTSVNFT